MSLSSWFLNLRLRVKLLIAFGSLVLLTVILVGIFFYTLKRMEVYETASEAIDGANIDVLEMDAAVTYFIFEGYKVDSFQQKGASAALIAYQLHREQVTEHLQALVDLPFDSRDSILNDLNSTLGRGDARIKELTGLLKVRGFKDFGLEGDLRGAIHAVEKSNFPYNKADMLTLRRHEKDFFLRKDLKYQKEFNENLDSFLESIGTHTEDGKEEIAGLLKDYKRQFNAIVDIESKIGLRETDGLKGAMNQELNHLKASIIELRTGIKATSAHFKNKALAGLVILFIIQFILGVTLAIVYSNLITHAIQELQHAMQKLAEGIYPEPLIVKSGEEIGLTKVAFNQFLKRLRAAAAFAEALGNGNIKADYASEFTGDILANSMIKMRAQLADAHEKQSVANWINTGVASLNDVLKMDTSDMAMLGNHLLKMLVGYLNANQGALYLAEGDGDHLGFERIATYAYGKKRFMQQRIEAGEGLIGQAALEKNMIFITDIPESYIRITSGLGEAIPACVVIVPLKRDNQVMGVLELASFKKFQDHEINFLERISENIASLLSNRKNAMQTLKLLEEVKQRQN
jgi:putative methionine-R-sulfoxide reductase with GAF domain/HAMP domain-containing protein